MATTLALLSVLLGGMCCILVAVVIFILKQPNPNKGRELAEIQEIQERVNDLSKQLIAFEKKIDKSLQESKNEHLSKLDSVNKDVGRQLQQIHENL